MTNDTKRNTLLNPNSHSALSRRRFLQVATASLVAGFAIPVLSPLSPLLVRATEAATGNAVVKTPGSKALIVYFSLTGNTRTLAGLIRDRVGGDMLELKTAHSYPEEYRATTEQAKRELSEKFRPTLTTDVEDVRPYDTVFIGYPIWWGTMPTACFTFLEKHDLAGKTIAPFCTHEGSGLARGPQDVAALCPKSRVLEGLAVRGSQVSEAQKDVDQWLQRVGLAQ